MELRDDREPLIDPEVRAFVFSLVSALGGSSAGDEGRYVLGDDALAVLKDIKRWLKLYDDKTNRLDVARLLAEANLVKGDLLEILAGWPEDSGEVSFRSKISLLCVDLLTQLTWPVEKDEIHTKLDHFMHLPYLHNAQANYKRAILQHDTTHMLRTIVRVALPSLAQDKNQRSPMEENIIKVVLYFLRNMALITKPESTNSEEDDEDISRSATIDAFHRQDIFNLMLTLGSSMHEDFQTHDVEMIDVLFHLLKGIEVDRLFMERSELLSSNTKELQQLIGKEKNMHAEYARHAPSRHNRFDSMLWIKRDGGKTSTVFGQAALANEQLTMIAMDKSKNWKKPRRGARHSPENPADEFDSTVPLTASARKHLRQFVESFLDSSFNPLFIAVRKAIEREADRVLGYHIQQYFYLVAWFLRAETARRKRRAIDNTQISRSNDAEPESFSLIAGVLNQETFVLLNRSLQTSQDDKSWKALNAGMKCFTQILLTVQEMSSSPIEEDQDIAENILNRIFYEQTTHDRIIGLLRTYKDQGFGYLDAVTELSHVFLRVLEQYSKQNVDLQIRTRRRARKKKQLLTVEHGDAYETSDQQAEAAAADIAYAQKTSSERKFDFQKFAAKFINQSSVDTYIALLRFYNDLSTEQLKRCHRFLYRCAFKMELGVYLFRMDTIALLHKMIQDSDGLSKSNMMFKDWEELSRQLFRALGKKLKERPALGVELLFSKIPSTMFYLEHGYDREILKKMPRPPAELEVKPGMEANERLGVAVSVLINQSKFELITWIKDVLSSASEERRSWEDSTAASSNPENLERQQESSRDLEGNIPMNENDEATISQQPAVAPSSPAIFIKPETTEQRLALEKDKYFRLLLTLLGIQTLGFAQSSGPSRTTWVIPSSISSSELSTYLSQIKDFEFNLPTYPDGRSAEDFLRRKVSYTRENVNGNNDERQGGQNLDNHIGSDSEGGSLPSDTEAPLYPPGGPTIKPLSPSRRLKQRRHRNRHTQDEHIDPSVIEERRVARRKLEAERASKIKSALYVGASDDESDEERDRVFFEKEGRERMEISRKLMSEMKSSKVVAEGNARKDGKKRKSSAVSDEATEHNDELSTRKRRWTSFSRSDVDVSTSGSDSDTSSKVEPSKRVLASKQTQVTTPAADAARSPSSSIQASSSPARNLVPDDSEADTDTDTPLSSQASYAAQAQKSISASLKRTRLVTIDDDDRELASLDAEEDVEDEDSDKENAQGRQSEAALTKRLQPPPKPTRRNVRAGFIIESDDDDDE